MITQNMPIAAVANYSKYMESLKLALLDLSACGASCSLGLETQLAS